MHREPNHHPSDAAAHPSSTTLRRPRYDVRAIETFIQTFRRDGFCILPQHIPAETLERWRKAFPGLLEARIRAHTASARGPQRWYVSLPFVAPWSDPMVFEDPDILAIVEPLGGNDIVMPEFATDTPLPGAEYQVIHRDHPLRSPDLPDLGPEEPFQFAVNFPLVDITRENGPFEIVRGTHTLTDEEAKELVRSGEAERRLEPLFMAAGDVMVRDVRALHRGSPNHSSMARPMVVVGYNRARHQRPQLRIFLPRDEQAKLSDRARRLLRLNPVVDDLAAAEVSETYSNLNFLNPYV